MNQIEDNPKHFPAVYRTISARTDSLEISDIDGESDCSAPKCFPGSSLVAEDKHTFDESIAAPGKSRVAYSAPYCSPWSKRKAKRARLTGSRYTPNDMISAEGEAQNQHLGLVKP